MSQRAVVSDGVIANDVVEYRIAQGGFVHDIIRALVAIDGVALEYWPPQGDGTDPTILFTTDEITSRGQSTAPTDAQAEINFVRDSGFYFYTDFPNPNISAQFMSPALDGTAGDDGKYLVRLDVVSGVFIGDATGVWIDINSDTQHRWFVEQSGVGVANGEADVTVAADDGGGSPQAGTEVVKRVNFIATVVGENDINWSSSPWNISELTEGIDANCTLDFNSNGTSVGAGDTSGNFNEDWHSGAPTPGDISAWTVQTDLVSGDAPTGDALGAALPLTSARNWTLLATSGEDFSNELDVTVSDGIDIVTKRVTMHSARTDVANDLVLQTNTQTIIDTGLNAAVTGGLIIKVNGQLVGSTNNSPPALIADDIFGALAEQWNEDWHAASPAASDSDLYEAQLVLVSGDEPTGGAPLDVFINCQFELAWFWSLAAAPPAALLNGTVDLTMQLLGQPSTAITKRVIVQVNVEQEGGNGP